MKTPVSHTEENQIQQNRTQQSTQFKIDSSPAFRDARPESVAHHQLQQVMNTSTSPQATQLKSLTKMMAGYQPIVPGMETKSIQLVEKQGPGDQGMINVEEVADYVPNCVDTNGMARKFYRRATGITSGWNNQDLFYADDDGPLVQVTTTMVNDYWNPKYAGFDQIGGPDWTINCEDYAKAAGFGAKAGDYTSTQTLSALISNNGNYVLELSYHWMRVAKTGADALTIRQKDGESAIYQKDFNLANGLSYILDKRSAGGSVYGG